MDKNWFNKSKEEIFQEFGISEDVGLNLEQVIQNREKYGSNELQAQKKKSLFIKFLEQFKDFMIIVLIIAAIVSGVVGYIEEGKITDSIIILVVVIVNAIIGVAQEAKAEKSLEALQKLSSHSAKVIRNGKMDVVASRELVPGDIVVLDTGDYVPADLRIIEAANLKSQEASLTGESVPSEKNTLTIEKEKVGVGDRDNMLFSSSLITYGRGKGVVVETGMNTEVGKIAGIISNTIKSETPLQSKLNKLGKTLGIAALGICVVIFVIGLLYGKQPLDMFMTAVSLAVAAIPEGLAAVSTIVLAIGVQRMVKRNAIVKKLPAVETLGSASVICSDKTGTLTQNKMTVQKVFYDGKLVNMEDIDDDEIPDLKRLVHISMLCNDTKVSASNELTGDPTETALVDMGFKLDFTPELYVTYPRVEELPFDSERKLMTTVHQIGDKYIVYTKGGVDELLKRCKGYEFEGNVKYDLDEYKSYIIEENEKMAQKALRVLAMAYKDLDHKPTEEEMKNIESELIYVGMVGMIDPPREEVKAAVEKCKSAGIKTVMITGDHKITATAIAKALGIMEEGDEAITGAELEEISDADLIERVKHISVYARVSPEHKVRIVKAWQANGEIVAMTGDGVNDAPALKTSDIGCAMGIVGTDVSKEAADVILTDDNFSTIVSAVEEGRRIYDNILKAIQFLLSSNVGEIIILFLAILIAPLLASKFGIDIKLIEPLLPIHILWVNLVTDSLPALALAVDPAEKDIMNRKPNKKQKGIFTNGMTWRIVYQGAMIGLLTLTAFILGLATKDVPVIDGKTPEEVRVAIAQTMAFAVLALSELVHIFNIRNNRKSLFTSGLFSNIILIGAIVLSAGFMFVVLLVPALRNIFSIVPLPMTNIIETICLVFAPVVIVEIFKLFRINTIKGE
jgi:Ca2+-transporting ATPase